jgi:hypothetical protein
MPLVDLDLPLLALGKQLALEMGCSLHVLFTFLKGRQRCSALLPSTRYLTCSTRFSSSWLALRGAIFAIYFPFISVPTKGKQKEIHSEGK